jgi:hypothetical protein
MTTPNQTPAPEDRPRPLRHPERFPALDPTKCLVCGEPVRTARCGVQCPKCGFATSCADG